MRTVSLLIVSILVIAGSCATPSQDVTEALDLVPIVHTVYTDQIELFVEFKPLVVGSLSKFAAHFTQLGDVFLPITEGQVTVSLVVGNRGIKQTASSPSSPGIYRLSLNPTVAGTGTLIFDIVTPNFTDQIIIENVKVYESAQAVAEPITGEVGGGDITYLKEQAWKVNFATIPVVSAPMHRVIRTSGIVRSAPKDEFHVTASVSGSVQFMNNRIQLGSVVSKGAPLFLLSGGDLQSGSVNARFIETKNRYEKLKSDYERALELAKDRIVSERDLSQAKLDYDLAERIYREMAELYSANGLTVQSPITGYVSNLSVREGQYVVAGTPLAVVSKNELLILQASVPQRDVGALASIRSAHFRIAGTDLLIETRKLHGRVISYSKALSNESPFLQISFEITNPGYLIPGTSAEVYLHTESIPDVLAVPKSALMEEQGSYYVFVQVAGERFQKRQVVLGADDGLRVQVIRGVAEGERVVTKGAYSIKLSMASGALPAHGHEH